MEPRIPKPAPAPARGPAPTKQYALRFISGKYQGGEFVLPTDREIVIGRSSELDMVLVEDMVSRRHAKITVSGEEIVIQDLGSTNGTFVNGEKVKRTRINEGDRILVGTSIMKLVLAETQHATASSGEPNANQKLEQQASMKRTQHVRTMSGLIEEVPVPDLLQLFSTSKKSGVLVIRTENQGVGKIYLDKGQITFAAVNDDFSVPPMKAAVRILGWGTGQFELDPPDERDFPNKLEMTTEGVLMEAMRQIDEMERVRADLPPLSAQLGLNVPLKAKLRDLSPEELDVLQDVLNSTTVESLLNSSQRADADVAEKLGKLIKSGYVKTDAT